MIARVVLVGCGFHAGRAHLPVLSAARDRVRLVAAVELATVVAPTRHRLDSFGLADTALVAIAPEVATSAAALWAQLDGDIGAIDGVIVSTPPTERARYLHWALDRGARALCDKPVLVRPFAAVDGGAARGTWSDFEEIRRRASPGAVIVGTQRRYHPYYRHVADVIHEVHAVTGESVTFVQALTNDGLYPRDYTACSLFDPVHSGGGKLINTGYHLLDLIPWLIRHAPHKHPITRAEVYAHAVRAGDLAEGSCTLTGRGNEVNAAVQVGLFDDEGRVACQVQLGAMHAGMSTRDHACDPAVDKSADWQAAAAGRAKQEMLSLHQGHAAVLWLRRFTGFRAGAGAAFGQRGHAELTIARAPRAGGEPTLETITHEYQDDEGAPTREFLELLTGHALRPSVSPLEDHDIPMRLLSATYCSLICGAPEKVQFEPGAWATPR